MADRIVVLSRGQIVEEFDGKDATEESIVGAFVGATHLAVASDGGDGSTGTAPVMSLSRPPAHLRSINDFPRIDVATTGRYHGSVYVTFHSSTPPFTGATDVYFSRSSNGGATWSAPVRLNDVTTDKQWWPVVYVEPGGDINAAWYDRRNNTAGAGKTDES